MSVTGFAAGTLAGVGVPLAWEAPRELFVMPMGGLANRMRAMVSGCLLAGDAGVPLRVLWQPQEELGACFEELFVDSGLAFPVAHCGWGRYLCCYSVPRRRNLYVSALWRRLRFGVCLSDSDGSILPYQGDYGRLCRLVRQAGRVCISSGLSFYRDEAEVYRRLFRPAAEVAARVERITSRFAPHTVGIHVRRTDNRQSILHSPLELFVEEMERLVAEDAGTHFYVASDDEACKRTLQARFGRRIVTYPATIRRDSREGVRDALAELFALAATSRILGSHYSSFSEVASHLGGIPLTQLYR